MYTTTARFRAATKILAGPGLLQPQKQRLVAEDRRFIVKTTLAEYARLVLGGGEAFVARVVFPDLVGRIRSFELDETYF